MKKELAFISLALLFFGCSGSPDVEIPEHSRGLENLTVYEPDAEPAMNIEFFRETSFGDTDDIFFRFMTEVSVDDYGRVYIADAMQYHIIVFNPDGTYHSTVGRRGSGPGEFLNIQLMKIRSGHLYVYDPVQQWINIFTIPSERDSAPLFTHTVNVMIDNWNQLVETGYGRPQIRSIRSDGSMLMHSRATPGVYGDSPETDGFIRYHILDGNSGSLSDVIFEEKMSREISGSGEIGQFSLSPNFFGGARMALSADDHIISAWTDDFLIRVHDPEGAYLRGFYYPVNKRILEREEAISFSSSESIQQVIRNADLPETWPVLVSMITDDENRLWIAVRTESKEMNEWWVLDMYGDLQAKFTWTADLSTSSIREVKDDYLYAMEMNEASGLREVIRYRIEMGESN